MKFNELQLSDKILTAIEEIGYNEATPIQELAIPKILEKKDIIGIAQTGTGKTASFALPIIETLIKEYNPDRRIKALILTPTRELAIQIRDNILQYAKNTDFKCSVILGGVNQHSQINVLKKGIDILVATPGRLLDLINQHKADVGNVKMLVLDEADTMFDMGFIKDVTSIVNKTSKDRQTLLFSATITEDVKKISSSFMKNPIQIKTKVDSLTADNINQELYYVDKMNKANLLLDILSSKDKPTTLVFTRTKHGANDLEEKLKEFNIKTSVIHGNKTQSNRVKALKDFKSGKTRILIATDIAARGIDITDLGLVINYDIPEKAELYVHRIGRTARAGKSGKAISFCSSAELQELKYVEKLIGKSIPVVENTKYPMVMIKDESVKKSQHKSSRKPRSTSYSNNNKPLKKFEEKSYDKQYKKTNDKSPYKMRDNGASRKPSSTSHTNNKPFKKYEEKGYDKQYKKNDNKFSYKMRDNDTSRKPSSTSYLNNNKTFKKYEGKSYDKQYKKNDNNSSYKMRNNESSRKSNSYNRLTQKNKRQSYKKAR